MSGKEPTQSAAQHDEKREQAVSIRNILQSVFAAALGVQSAENRERDFKQGNIKTFIIAGLIFTVLFIGGVFTVVQLVLASR